MRMAQSIDGQGVPPGYRVLLVEDDALVADTATSQLEAVGCQVAHVAPDAEAAIAWIEAGGDVDLLFADIVMPGMNGVALAVALNEKRPDIRVLLTTGYGSALLDEQSRHYQVIGKPFRVDEVEAAIVDVAAQPIRPELRA
jgi:CheY-like chemotaxis protein